MSVLYFMEVWHDALDSENKESFVNKWLQACIWGPLSLQARRQLEVYLCSLWDAAHMSIREMCKTAGMTQLEYAQYFDIPLRTVEAWCRGLRNPPKYDRLMMLRLLGLMPSFHSVAVAFAADNKSTVKVKAIPKKENSSRKDNQDMERKPNDVKSETCMRISLSIADLVAKGVPVKVDQIEDAGLDIATLPPLELIAIMEGDTLSFYYRFEHYGIMFSAFGIKPDPDYSLEDNFREWMGTICAEYIIWEDLAKFYP